MSTANNRSGLQDLVCDLTRLPETIVRVILLPLAWDTMIDSQSRVSLRKCLRAFSPVYDASGRHRSILNTHSAAFQGSVWIGGQHRLRSAFSCGACYKICMFGLPEAYRHYRLRFHFTTLGGRHQDSITTTNTADSTGCLRLKELSFAEVFKMFNAHSSWSKHVKQTAQVIGRPLQPCLSFSDCDYMEFLFDSTLPPIQCSYLLQFVFYNIDLQYDAKVSLWHATLFEPTQFGALQNF